MWYALDVIFVFDISKKAVKKLVYLLLLTIGNSISQFALAASPWASVSVS